MVFRRKNGAKYSKSAWPLGLFVTLFAAVQALTVSAHAAELPAVPSPTFDQARIWYAAAKTNYFHHTGNTTSAWKFAEACFEWAEFSSNNTQRASLA
ncbi:MAG: hypothetical protein ACXW32_17790, partial [Limisphaerales bacterium]